MSTTKPLRKLAINFFSFFQRKECISELAFGCVYVCVNLLPPSETPVFVWVCLSPRLHESETPYYKIQICLATVMKTQRFAFCFPQWERALIGRLREPAKRDESDSGDRRVRERVWCWSRSDRVRALVQTSPRPLTRTPDRVRFLPNFDFFFWQRRILDNSDFGQRGRTLPLSTARNLDFGQRGFCHGVDFFSRNEWQQLFGKWATDPDHYSVFLPFHFPLEENHQIEITVNPENEAKLMHRTTTSTRRTCSCMLFACGSGKASMRHFFDVTLVCDSSPVA